MTTTLDAIEQRMADDAPLLPPIENPPGLMMKLVYAMSRWRFGRVLNGFKVGIPRLPLAFFKFYGKVSQLDKKLVLPQETAILIRQQVARINTCSFCIDIAQWFAMKAGIVSEATFDALAQYRTSPLFTDAQRAALNYVTELTKEKKVNATTFARLQQFYSEREICEIVWLVASEHLYNMTNIGLNIHSEGLCKVPTV
jgi:alkylhydroperoxidase family enzyme